MFFIGIIGGGIRAKPLGASHPRICPRCHNTEPWTVYETSKYLSLFFVTIARWNRRYHMTCPICHETLDIDSREEAFDSIAASPTGKV
jgi:hypothetical protein